jgi:DNA polymerase
MKLSREQMLAEMGIAPIWRVRTELPAAIAVPADEAVARENIVSEAVMAGGPPSVPDTPRGPAVAVDAMDWPELAAAVAACRKCALCEQRRQAVLGVGDRDPDWLFIGEGPGAEEDVRGEPFVGQAGKLLDAMLAALGLQRGEKVYIANAVKCRPPGNRTPEAGEMAACRPYLERQVTLLRPKIIVLLGKAAVHSLLREDKSLAALRGQRFEWHGIPVVVTYHPAYLLRNLPDKAKAWEDLLFARRCLREAAMREAPLLI